MITAVFLASGHAKRFGEDKLLYPVDGVPMAERAFRTLPPEIEGVVVTRSEAVAALARGHANLRAVMNPDQTDDQAVTIRLGCEAVPETADGVMFFVCDQPYLRRESVEKLCRAFENEPDKCFALSYAGAAGNPCVFPRRFMAALKNLPPDTGGKHVLRTFGESAVLCEVLSPEELRDLDEKPQHQGSENL